MIEARIRRVVGAFQLDAEFQAPAGITVLFGASGAGKTMTLDSIAGFVRPDAGRILLDGAILFDAEAGVNVPPQRRRCGYVPQSYALFPHMTLRENLVFAVENLPKLDRHRRVNEMLERFGLEAAADRSPLLLSGGQQQRGSIARALLTRPKVLLLDEPSRGLDAPLRTELYAVLREIRREFETPILLVTHDLAECLELGDGLVLLQQGKVVQSGVPAAVAERPATVEVARLLGLYNLLPAEILQLDPQRNTSRLRVAGHDIEGRYYPGHLKGDRVTICIRRDHVRAHPRNGRPPDGSIPARLTRTAPRPLGALLEFDNGIQAEMAEAPANETQWVVVLPPEAVHVLDR
jgi:molybdate transport system ATP-binding protein